ncbi:MAG TPA: hypothetical protein VLR29_03185 [Flavobacterium sp.]|nr:hypothetical protein [Flavobacterium sp.]
MKNVYLYSGTVNEVFNQIESSCKGVLKSNNDEFKLALDTDLMKGTVDGISFINGISSIQVNLTFFDDVTLSFESLSKSSILFAYCGEGYLTHSAGISGHKSTLKKHHSGVLTGSQGVNTVVQFKKDMSIKFSIIKVETESELNPINDSLLSQLKKTFVSIPTDYSYQGIQNLKIAEKLKELHSIKDQGMVGHILKKEIVQSILAMEINDHTDNLVKISYAVKHLAMKQINQLINLPKVIRNFAVESLYNKVGTSKTRSISSNL